MANYFQLPDGVRVSKNLPIDGDRYVVADISQRNQLITDGRSFNGLQVYVESNNTLYLYKEPIWIELSTSTFESSPTQILFNSGGTISGTSNLTYNYDDSIFQVSDVKSIFSIRPSYSNDPTLLLKSNFGDGVEIDVANNLNYAPVISTIKSKGTQTSKSNIINDILYYGVHQGYHNSEINSAVTATQISITAKDWSSTSYASEYLIKTVSSGNTNLDDRFKIDYNGAIQFNNSYTFPTTSGTSGQILTQSGNGYLYWSDNLNNVFSENIGSGGTHEFIIGNVQDTSLFIRFVNSGLSCFQMGELQILSNDIDTKIVTNTQDIDLPVIYNSRLDGNDIILICNVPAATSDIIMKYRIEKF